MDMFASQTEALHGIFAKLLSTDAAAFSREELVITEKDPSVGWPFSMMALGFGTGTVVCAEERYVEWVRDHAPAQHERAGYLVLPLVAEAAGRGEALDPVPPMLGWALGRHPEAASAPEGYRLEPRERDWMNAWQQKDVFPNALGQSVQGHRGFRNQFAYALFDERDEPAAVAGMFDTAGLSEIGVDVADDARGRGLAPVVVSAVARTILDQGGVPYYACTVTNVRSQRTALSSGFLPACWFALAMPAGVGLV
jgi:hypothetical protein